MTSNNGTVRLYTAITFNTSSVESLARTTYIRFPNSCEIGELLQPGIPDGETQVPSPCHSIEVNFDG